MKILKLVFIFFIIVFTFLTLITFIVHQNYNLNKIIYWIEKENNIKIEFIEKPKWVFFPKIKLNFIGSIKDNSNKFHSENIDFSFYQNYKFVPIGFNIKNSSFFLEGLEIKSLKLNGEYNLLNGIINFQNIYGKIGQGLFESRGTINTTNDQLLTISGNFKNLYLNQILKQLNLANWQRVELRVSSNNYEFHTNLVNNLVFLNNLKGNLPIEGSVYFVTSEEESFGIAFLSLLVEQMFPNYNKLSKILSQIINNFSGSPTLFKGNLEIENGIIYTSNLTLEKNNSKINLEGTYDIIKDNFDTKIFFIESEKLLVEAKILGKLDNPSIEIINDNKLFDDQQIDNDLKKIFDEGIENLIEKLLNLNE